MGAIYYKQPNGRFCRYSTICDAVTDYIYMKIIQNVVIALAPIIAL